MSLIASAAPSAPPHHFAQIDEDGYFVMNGLRVADADAGREWLERLKIDNAQRVLTQIDGSDVIVEAFDAPLIALDFEALPGEKNRWQIRAPYQHIAEIDMQSLSVDEWDRFHGRTMLHQVPFVLSRQAQARFFDLLDSFDDDSITISGRTIATGPWLLDNENARENRFWNELYQNDQARWDLGTAHPSLASVMPQLKIHRSRILVLGAGAGHDAAWFAQQGHIVTAVDFSSEAVSRAKARYGNTANLKFIEADAFHLPSEMLSAFDIVFEHTCYCAIEPSRRNDLMKVWRRALVDRGHLFGIFFANELRSGPPFGGSEWELSSRLRKSFLPLYWTRLHDSPERRLGLELFIYAQKLSAI